MASENERTKQISNERYQCTISINEIFHLKSNKGLLEMHRENNLKKEESKQQVKEKLPSGQMDSLKDCKSHTHRGGTNKRELEEIENNRREGSHEL